jgi:lipopolysaccharide export system ATP-binding protein
MSFKLEIDSVLKTLGNRFLLSDVYFSCTTGEIIGLFGRNGTGKSTFLKILFGSMYAENKHITLNGEKMDKPFSHKNTVALLPQNLFIPKYLKVETSANLYLENSTSIDDFFDDDVINLLRKKRINELSFGELRYLEIKILLYSKNKFILLDEPFQGLSPIYVEKVKELIVNASETKGIVITDHNYTQLVQLINKFYLIKDGKMFLLKNKDELRNYGYLN